MSASRHDRAKTPSPAHSSGPATLRHRAEEKLRRQQPTPEPHRTEADLQRLVHELQVHQIELEMQNNELHQARDEREEALLKYSDLYDFAPIGYITLNRAGMVLESNLAAANLFGLERSRLVKRRLALHVAMTERPALAAFLAQVFAGKTGESCEVTVVREGRPAAEVRIKAIADASGEECRTVLENITAQKQAEIDRLVLSKLESTGVLADGLSHDFNNLLTVIVLNLELAQTLGPPTGRQADLLAAAKRSALVAGELSRELNRFARADAPVRKPVSLVHVLQASTRPEPDGPGVKCELSLKEELWPTAVDEGQIGEVIRRVVTNAKEAMPLGGMIFIRADNVVVGTRQSPALSPGDYVRVSIADHGSGIAKAAQSKVFDPYFSTKMRGSQKGMGLGLAISQAVVRSHGGAMTVESTEGAGATFHIHLPASRPSSGSAPAHA